QLGKNVEDPNLAQLVNESSKDTSLYELRRFARELGLHCLAVKTDIQTLRNVQDGQVILHLPKAEHYVVLDHVDEEYVWAIDLDGNKFYYRTRLSAFSLDWSEGTALLVSNGPLNVEGTFIEVNDQEQRNIVGSAGGGFGTYSCTDTIQEKGRIHCEPPIVFCNSVYEIIYKRYSCQLDPEGGYCTGEPMIGSIRCICIDDPYNLGACKGSGEWYSRYIRACM
ncbi:MAG: cysteine peptidase family C39 domain-containing protein, partial [Planctomycetota bacterium]